MKESVESHLKMLGGYQIYRNLLKLKLCNIIFFFYRKRSFKNMGKNRRCYSNCVFGKRIVDNEFNEKL